MPANIEYFVERGRLTGAEHTAVSSEGLRHRSLFLSVRRGSLSDGDLMRAMPEL